MTSLTETGAVHVDAAGVPVFDHVSFLCRTMLSGQATGGLFSLVEERGRLGCMSPRHVHEREAETFVVLDGALEGWCAGEMQMVEAGSLIYLPAGREHAFRVASSTAHFLHHLHAGRLRVVLRSDGLARRAALRGRAPGAWSAFI